MVQRKPQQQVKDMHQPQQLKQFPIEMFPVLKGICNMSQIQAFIIRAPFQFYPQYYGYLRFVNKKLIFISIHCFTEEGTII